MNLETKFMDVFKEQNNHNMEDQMPTSGLIFYAPLKNANVEVGSFNESPTNVFEKYQNVPSVLCDSTVSKVAGNCTTTESFTSYNVNKTISIWINPAEATCSHIIGVSNSASDIASPWMARCFRLKLEKNILKFVWICSQYRS